MSTGSKSCQINITFNRRNIIRYDKFDAYFKLITGTIFCGLKFADKNVGKIKFRWFVLDRIATNYCRRDSQEQKHKIAFEISLAPAVTC